MFLHLDIHTDGLTILKGNIFLTKLNPLDGAFVGGSEKPFSINCDEINSKIDAIELKLTVGGDINLYSVSLKSQLWY